MTDEKLNNTTPEELGARLQAARKAVQKTQDDVATALGVARTTVTAIEKGERRVQATELLKLAELYGRSLNELLRSGGSARPLAVQLRAAIPREDRDLSTLEPFFAEFQALAEDYVELERLCESPLPRRYPTERRIEGVSPEAMAEDLAQSERTRLQLGDGPIHRLREVLEREVGLRVFYPRLPSHVSGMFIFDDALGGCIAANGNHPPERIHQSIVHEYAHFLTSRQQPSVDLDNRYRRVPEHERFAFAFSPAFLMPEAGLKRRFHQTKGAAGGKFSPADLVSLAHYYGVSVASLTNRLEDLRLVSRGSWDQLSGRGFRVSEARQLLDIADAPEHRDLLPARYILLAIHAFDDGKLTEGQFARFLRADLNEARRVYREYRAAAVVGEPDTSVTLLEVDRPTKGLGR
jgi:Zn-dependent peptidase ImmA (M78 family)/DNA-binding XRE family transcriptional regulator